MRYHVLAADYDGTLAQHGVVDEDTWDALRRLRSSGRRAIIVSGRDLDDLLAILPAPSLFHRIVAENGAVVYAPDSKETRVLAAPPSEALVAELRRRKVTPLQVGRAIIATWEPHHTTVLQAIHELGLELHVIFNKGAVMVLPSGINKATGLAAALAELGMSAHDAVGIGDAENDHAMLDLCECGVAVANALPAVKQHADLITTHDHGAGVVEVIDRLLADDLEGVRLPRRRIPLGIAGEREIAIDPYASAILIAGTSGSGKSTVTTGILERLAHAGYQFALVDPEGDYTSLESAVALGTAKRAPTTGEVLDVLRDPGRNVVMNLLGVPMVDRPPLLAQLWHALAELRARSGRPHWLVIDEAHHLLPRAGRTGAELPARTQGAIYVTVHPNSMAVPVLRTINTVLALGEEPDTAIHELCEAADRPSPGIAAIETLPPGSVLYWALGDAPAIVRTAPPKTERTRHSRKYAEGDLGAERSFYFRGREGKLHLKANNLQLFVQLAAGVDDDTWLFHLRRRDYSRWMRTEVKDDDLADEVAAVERDRRLGPAASRVAVVTAVDNRYTLPG